MQPVKNDFNYKVRTKKIAPDRSNYAKTFDRYLNRRVYNLSLTQTRRCVLVVFNYSPKIGHARLLGNENLVCGDVLLEKVSRKLADR